MLFWIGLLTAVNYDTALQVSKYSSVQRASGYLKIEVLDAHWGLNGINLMDEGPICIILDGPNFVYLWITIPEDS